jgi:hypothetical protein
MTMPTWMMMLGLMILGLNSRRNHARQIEYRGGPNFEHYNFKLIDKIQGYQQQLGMLDEASDIGRWRPPTVGRCRVTVSKPVLKAPMVSALETEI